VTEFALSAVRSCTAVRYSRSPQRELEVEAGREARALGLQRALVAGRWLPAPPNGIARLGASQPAHDPAQTEEAPRAASGVFGRYDHLRTIRRFDTETSM
jgi:hypothetical protein